jgi:hypothetical protein
MTRPAGEDVAGAGELGELESAVAHLLKVMKSYGRGLFHCYEIPGSRA